LENKQHEAGYSKTHRAGSGVFAKRRTSQLADAHRIGGVHCVDLIQAYQTTVPAPDPSHRLPPIEVVERFVARGRQSARHFFEPFIFEPLHGNGVYASYEFLDPSTVQMKKPTKPKKKRKAVKKKDMVLVYLQRQLYQYEHELWKLLKQRENMIHEAGHFGFAFFKAEYGDRLELIEGFVAQLGEYRAPKEKKEEEPKKPHMRDFFENRKGKRKWSS
jgi:hypothetical protein